MGIGPSGHGPQALTYTSVDQQALLTALGEGGVGSAPAGTQSGGPTVISFDSVGLHRMLATMRGASIRATWLEGSGIAW
ncbi:MAG TPA: hypothetical protein VNG93_04985 [Candidatus Dormibacteraeota bacterium]|nr:hypothetical protein [Candidatus Dormibacteraeota bacterium]